MNNNEYLFKSKIYKYGFYLNSKEYLIYINPDKYKLLFLNKINNIINGYIIVINDISGINYNLDILKKANIIIESKIIYNYSYNINTNIYNLDKYKYNYMYISIDLKDCINNFNLYNIIQTNYLENLIKEGLPYWCNFCFFINKQIRIIVQIIMIFVEIGILIWSIYQIFETFPDMIK